MNEELEYYRYTGPQRIDKAMHTLEGILKGVALDDTLTATEVQAVRDWTDLHSRQADRHPFNEVIPLLETYLEDGHIDEDERLDLLDLCQRLTTKNAYFDAITSDLQRLHGILKGIAADSVVSKAELQALQEWLDEHEELTGSWPYDEISALIVSTLNDGRIDIEEHEMLLRFCDDFVVHSGHRTLNTGDVDLKNITVIGICATCPEIVFERRSFCFTGHNSRASKAELHDLVLGRNGFASVSVTAGLDYLVVGAGGNPCWAFSCYGRKVEQAVKLRKLGRRLTIVHENDFWDAVSDL